MGARLPFREQIAYEGLGRDDASDLVGDDGPDCGAIADFDLTRNLDSTARMNIAVASLSIDLIRWFGDRVNYVGATLELDLTRSLGSNVK